MGFMIEEVGRNLGKQVGYFLEYDSKNSTTFWKNYMCIRVLVDVRKALLKEKMIKRGRGAWWIIQFKYEKLGQLCYLCGHLG